MKTHIRGHTESGNQRQTSMAGGGGCAGREPTCTEGSDILVHLEADNRAVVINDVCLSVPGTGHHLLHPVALQEARDKIAGWPGAVLERDRMTGLGEIQRSCGLGSG